MYTNQRPPVAHKKGIGVLQPSKTHKLIDTEDNSSGLRSVRSSSRSRGISMSRSSGINIDKIYQNKHFPPPSIKKNNDSFDKTLGSCKSLKLISVQSQAATINDKESQLKTDSQLKDQPFGVNKLQANSKLRSSSPISKLNFGTISSQISLNEKQRKLLNF